MTELNIFQRAAESIYRGQLTLAKEYATQLGDLPNFATIRVKYNLMVVYFMALALMQIESGDAAIDFYNFLCGQGYSIFDGCEGVEHAAISSLFIYSSAFYSGHAYYTFKSLIDFRADRYAIYNVVIRDLGKNSNAHFIKTEFYEKLYSDWQSARDFQLNILLSGLNLQSVPGYILREFKDPNINVDAVRQESILLEIMRIAAPYLKGEKAPDDISRKIGQFLEK